jgi:hypothetical protein
MTPRREFLFVKAALLGWLIAGVGCALAAWNIARADVLIRVLIPFSGGISKLGKSISHGIAIQCGLNALLYGSLGFLLSFLLDRFYPQANND